MKDETALVILVTMAIKDVPLRTVMNVAADPGENSNYPCLARAKWRSGQIWHELVGVVARFGTS